MKKKDAEAFAARMDFAKGNGLIVAMAQDAVTSAVLMQAFMDWEALVKTLTSGQMWYYSRSRKKLWRKGETSGCTQKLVDFSADCDRDALLFRVEQTGVACHTGSKTCFNEFTRKNNAFSLRELEQVIRERQTSPANTSRNSYTCKLLKNEKLLLKKIGEESAELIVAASAETRKEVVWEASDLVYHLLVLLALKGVRLSDLETELARRRATK